MKQKDVEEGKGMMVFVTIGVPFSRIPIMQKVAIFVDMEKETPIQVAKMLRKQVADNIEMHGWVKGINFTPAELYYEIYGSVNNHIPFAMSVNSPFMNQAC